MTCKYNDNHHHPLPIKPSKDKNGHNHDHGTLKDKKLLKLSFAITFVVMIVEIVGGIYVNSLALISDAIHMFTHAFALGLSLFALIISTKEIDDEKSFGYHRAEVLAAFINGLTIALSVLWIVYEAIMRLLHPEEILVTATIWIATLGLVVNVITGLILLRANHDNINIKSAFLHMLADTISSAAIILGAIVIYYTQFYILDTILALLVAIVIAKWAKDLLSNSIHVLLEGSPHNTQEIKSAILEEFEHVVDVHDIHCWEISHNYYYLTCHIVLDSKEAKLYNDTIVDVGKFLEDKFNIGHVTIQIEFSKLIV
ncbi:MAG: cation diffusion facilitator family transporter [Sulfurimonas sp.]|uniref:cation diffusion facilitator family transporter n=1 Tax=Sulfurimonas sp. TaxID=2022749 RepID=UPI0025F1676A|nr:cation diffusion facilitator family transporter [Sulfurimonas sp.]MCK9455565.1 cation diffusion facilitator family transporter [Sulfurimonas sp.]